MNKKKKLKVVIALQARMTSTRLPRKALALIEGKSVIECIVERLKKAHEADGVVLHITTQKEDDILETLARKIGIPCYRSENEKLIDGYYNLAKQFYADAVVRITADCPVVDHDMINHIIRVFRKNPKTYDYLTDVFPPSWPDGLDINMYPIRSLEYLYSHKATLKHHYTLDLNFMENQDHYRIYNFRSKKNLSHLRWTLDYPEDLVLMKELYRHFGEKDFGTKDILKLLKEKPELTHINEKYVDTTLGYSAVVLKAKTSKRRSQL
ncbi:MAG: NTP transferase domain-containing protein [bacterium]|nr:NTP transferase domain-containing protein [bacterium]